jgi:hypothetical protein
MEPSELFAVVVPVVPGVGNSDDRAEIDLDGCLCYSVDKTFTHDLPAAVEMARAIANALEDGGFVKVGVAYVIHASSGTALFKVGAGDKPTEKILRGDCG